MIIFNITNRLISSILNHEGVVKNRFISFELKVYEIFKRILRYKNADHFNSVCYGDEY